MRAVHQRDMLDAHRHDIGSEVALADDEAAILAHAAVGRDEAEFSGRAHDAPGGWFWPRMRSAASAIASTICA